jgi:prepilin-type processing-associated H-X9-DG protein
MRVWQSKKRSRRGVTLPEVLIVGAIVGLVVVVLLMAIPRSRETARLAGCNNNLAQIGRALAQFDGANGHLPVLPRDGKIGPGPLARLAEQFGFGYFEGNPTAKPSPLAGVMVPRKVRGFLCAADPNVTRANSFAAPTSYRGNAGPGTDGQGGAFAFGKIVSNADAEAAAGTDYTAGFAERLIGSGDSEKAPANDYQLVKGPVDADGCPDGPADSWRGDAGSNWVFADWTSTLYNHAMRPNESPSCVAMDEKTARMGASSGHQNRVNVLMLGGGVRGFTKGVDREIWRKFGAVSRK